MDVSKKIDEAMKQIRELRAENQLAFQLIGVTLQELTQRMQELA